MKNFNNSIREKEQKILDFYKTIRELSGNCKLAKSVVRKRTKKNLYLEKEKKDIQEKHDIDDHDHKDKLQKGGYMSEENIKSIDAKVDTDNESKNNFVVWD